MSILSHFMTKSGIKWQLNFMQIPLDNEKWENRPEYYLIPLDNEKRENRTVCHLTPRDKIRELKFILYFIFIKMSWKYTSKPTVSSSSCTAKKLLLNSTFSDLTSTSLSAVEKHFLLTFNCVYLMLGRIWKGSEMNLKPLWLWLFS